MGTFSYTCAITQTPIVGGNKVRVLFGVINANNEELRHNSRDTFLPFGLSLKAEYNEDEAGEFDWENPEINYYCGETICDNSETQVLRAIALHYKNMDALGLDEVINDVREANEEAKLKIGWMVIHEHVYQDIVTTNPLKEYSHDSIKEYFSKPKNVEKIEIFDSFIQGMVARKLESSGSIDDEGYAESLTLEFEATHGNNVALNYFSMILPSASSILRDNKSILKSSNKDNLVLFDNAAEVLALCRFMERYQLPMLQSKASRLLSSKGHIELYRTMAKWCEQIEPNT